MRNLGELTAFFSLMKTQQEDAHLWTGKWVLIRHRICWLLHLGSSSLRNCEKEVFVVYDLSILWRSVQLCKWIRTDQSQIAARVIFWKPKSYPWNKFKCPIPERHPLLCPQAPPAPTLSPLLCLLILPTLATVVFLLFPNLAISWAWNIITRDLRVHFFSSRRSTQMATCLQRHRRWSVHPFLSILVPWFISSQHHRTLKWSYLFFGTALHDLPSSKSTKPPWCRDVTRVLHEHLQQFMAHSTHSPSECRVDGRVNVHGLWNTISVLFFCLFNVPVLVQDKPYNLNQKPEDDRSVDSKVRNIWNHRSEIATSIWREKNTNC